MADGGVPVGSATRFTNARHLACVLFLGRVFARPVTFEAETPANAPGVRDAAR